MKDSKDNLSYALVQSRVEEGIPTNGWGEIVTDVNFLVSIIDSLLSGEVEELEAEDIAVIDRIKSGTPHP